MKKKPIVKQAFNQLSPLFDNIMNSYENISSVIYMDDGDTVLLEAQVPSSSDQEEALVSAKFNTICYLLKDLMLSPERDRIVRAIYSVIPVLLEETKDKSTDADEKHEETEDILYIISPRDKTLSNRKKHLM